MEGKSLFQNTRLTIMLLDEFKMFIFVFKEWIKESL